jgi:hypothetical protein
MRRRFQTVLACGLLWCGAAEANCVSLSTADKWTRVDQHTIMLLFRGQPVAAVRLPYCFVYPASKVNIVKRDVCVGDTAFMVDGTSCVVGALEKAPALQSRSPSPQGSGGNMACEGAIRRMELFCGNTSMANPGLQGLWCSRAESDVRQLCR